MRRNTWMTMVVCGGLVVGGCGSLHMGSSSQSWPLTVSSHLPAARGIAKVTPQSDGNTKLQVLVEHLAPADRVTSSATSYVVWVLPRADGQPQNMGALTLNKDLKGELTTVVPFRDFEVRVTAEPNPHVAAPTHPEVMQAMVHIPGSGSY